MYDSFGEFEKYFMGVFCTPADASGRPLLSDISTPGEKDGSSASGLSLEELQKWPMQFSAVAIGFEKLMFRVLIVTPTAMLSPFFVPYVTMNSMTPEQALSFLQDNSQPLSSEGFIFNFGRVQGINFVATLSKSVDAQESLKYAYQSKGTDLTTDAFAEACFQSLLNHTEDVAERQRLADARASPANTLLMVQVYIEPSSMEIQVISDHLPYTLSNFASDLGGYLNILSLSLVLLFPLAFAPTRPRSFLLLWLHAKWQQHWKHTEAHQQSSSSLDKRDLELGYVSLPPESR
jgi:hypothetical protein